MAASPGAFGRHSQVLLYVPNLIGYIRVALAFAAFAVAFKRPGYTVGLYFFSFVCDELDGRFARMFNQTSTFGAVLDMVTDRLATTSLLLLLSAIYPAAMVAPLGLIWLDIFSHWFQMYASLAMGETSHKDVASASWIVRMYYKHRLIMGACCISCEALYLSLYSLAWPVLRQHRIALPPPVVSALTPLLAAAAKYLPALPANTGSKGTVSIPLLLALLALPGFAIKQLCNMAQLRMAVANLIRYDQVAKGSSSSRAKRK